VRERRLSVKAGLLKLKGCPDEFGGSGETIAE
jgi:hypothetical protein